MKYALVNSFWLWKAFHNHCISFSQPLQGVLTPTLGITGLYNHEYEDV